MPRIYPSAEERFKAKFIVASSGCWEAIKRGSQGYGCMDLEGKTIPLHRAAWLILRGPIPVGLCVLHKCDNRPCCNPEHLYLGDKKENRRDFMERHPRAKELVAQGAAAGAAGARTFRASMTPTQEAEFVARRRETQFGKGAAS